MTEEKLPSLTKVRYPPQCCVEERAAHEAAGAARFAEDYHAGWDSRSLWKRFVSVLRSIRAPYRKAFATGYARASLAHRTQDWGAEEFVQAAIEAASVPPV
jgi:hypothetical protein